MNINEKPKIIYVNTPIYNENLNNQNVSNTDKFMTT